MRKAKVLFDYDPQEDDELSLKVGDIITDIEDADVGWCSGVVRGKKGMFPDNFVEMFEEEDKKVPAPPSASKKPMKKKIRKMKVKFPYVAENPDELSLEIGDIVEIVKDVEDGWAEGVNKRGKKGVFPTNFGDVFEELEENGDSQTTQEEIDNKQNEAMAPPQKKVKGVGFGNIFGDGPIKLRQRSIKDSDNTKAFSPPSKIMSPTKEKETPKAKDLTPMKPKETVPSKPSDANKPKKTGNYCKVMFDYVKDNEDELELKTGEIVLIVDKMIADDGWWEGEKTDENGKRVRGLFPDNFVAELSPEEAKEHERSFQPKSEPEIKSPKQPKESKKPSALMPALPSQNSKPTLTVEKSEPADISFSEPTTTEHTLSQFKRPTGPKNRRKPGASERREKAASAAADEEAEPSEESEEEKIVEKPREPVKKRESSKRGVAVLPGLGPGGDGGSSDTPSWLQNLKNRQSVKKTPPAMPPKESPEQPPWLANLKKRQSTESVTPPTQSKAPPTQPKVALQPKTDKPSNVPTPSLKPAAPKPSSPPPTEKPLAAWQIERQQKALKAKTAETNELQSVFGSLRRRKEKAPEPPPEQKSTPEPAWKNSLNRKTAVPTKPPTEPTPTMPVKKPDRGPAAPPTVFKPKPAPPKSKPAPAAKPASSSAVEELKNEVKGLKEEMAKIKEDFQNEVSRLSSELKTEMAHRILLEDEVRKMRQKLQS